MATAEGQSDLASFPRWAASLTGIFIAGTLLWGLVIIATSSPAFLAVPFVYPSATPFMWLAALGMVITLLGNEFSEEEAAFLERILEEVSDMNFREQFIYMLSLLVIVIGMISFEITVIGAASSRLASYGPIPLVGVIVAIWWPSFDAWLGRKINWNLASLGGMLAIFLMQAAAVMYRVSPSIPRAAGENIRTELVTHSR